MAIIKQSIEDFGGVEGLERTLAKFKKEAPYQCWLVKLNHNEKLPRGAFFKNKKPGRTVVLIDEAWAMITTGRQQN